MSVAFRAASSGTADGATSCAASKPAGTTTGDVLVAFLSLYGDFQAVLTPPAGWTAILTTATSGARTMSYAKVATGSEPSSYSWSWGNSTDATLIVAAYSDALMPEISSGASGNGTLVSAPSVTTVKDASLVAALLHVRTGSLTSADRPEAPAGTTQRIQSFASGVVSASVLADYVQAVAGATGAKSDAIAASNVWTAQQVVLAPANHAPNAPTPTSPADGSSVDRTNPIPLAATFSDPDPADSPSASKWRYRITGAATWTMVTQSNTLQSYSIPAGLAAGDYEWQASYADQAGTWGPYCGSSFFTAIDPPPGPVWLDPISGQTITADTYTGVISQASLSESEWTLYADNAGAINEAVVLQGPVSVTTGDLRRYTFTGLANNTPVWWSVRTKDAGLWSQPVQERTPVAFTPPPTPTLTVAASDPDGAISVTVTNPAPGAGEPAVDYVDIYARCPSWTPDADQYRPYSEAGTRIAFAKPVNSVLIDHLAASGVAYEYRAVAVANDGTTAASAWTSVDPAATPTIYYGGAY